MSRALDLLLALPMILIAIVLVGISLFLPYRARMAYVRFIAWVFHLPFIIFGRVATYLFRKLDVNPEVLRE